VFGIAADGNGNFMRDDGIGKLRGDGIGKDVIQGKRERAYWCMVS
jgi:hypothetical protein